MSKNNVCIGTLELTGIQKALRGEPKILVTFSIDSNAVLSVKAEDTVTKTSKEAVFTYDFSKSVNVKNEEREVLVVNLKERLSRLLAKHPGEKEQIEYAVETGNIEFMQSMIDDLTA